MHYWSYRTFGAILSCGILRFNNCRNFYNGRCVCCTACLRGKIGHNCSELYITVQYIYVMYLTAMFFLLNYNVLYCRLICTDRSMLVLFTEGSFWLLQSPPSWALDSSLTSGKWPRVMLLKVKNNHGWNLIWYFTQLYPKIRLKYAIFRNYRVSQ